MVFSCYKNESLRRNGENTDEYLLKLQKHLLGFVYSTPLNILVWTLKELVLIDPCKDFLNAYEEFLSQINDKDVREHLGTLNEEDVYTDTYFLRCREISHRLQATLKSVCFEIDSPLREFTCEDGVF